MPEGHELPRGDPGACTPGNFLKRICAEMHSGRFETQF